MISGVLEAGGLLRASTAGSFEQYLRRQGGVDGAEADPVSQFVTVRYDDAVLSAGDVRNLIEQFGWSTARSSS